jgi:hypothetical protein
MSKKKSKLVGIVEEPMETLSIRKALRQSLETQQRELESKVIVAEGEVARLKEYLAKIEGGLEVLDELDK